ncbi:MAG: glycosyltransferase family 9 protein [Gemmatimonadota bacterium]
MPETESFLPGRPRTPRRVSVVRSDNLGDVILFSGVLEHLRTLYPQARITLYVKDGVRDLVAACPHVDDVASWEGLLWPLRSRLEPFPGRDRLDNWWGRIRARLRPRPDLILVPLRSPSTVTHAGVAHLRGRWVVGTRGDHSNQTLREERQWAGVYSERCPMDGSPATTELEANRRFLAFLGGGHGGVEIRPTVWLHDEDHEWARTALVRAEGTRLLALAPGVTSLPGKFYGGEKLREAIQGVEGVRFSVHLLGSPAERAMNTQVAQAVAQAGNVVHLQDHTGATTLRELAAALTHVDVLLSQETGALHLATALGTPTVGLLGGGHHGRFYPWGDPERNRVADHPMDCYHCNWVCRYDTIRCIQEIPPSRISRELTRALAAEPTSPSR